MPRSRADVHDLTYASHDEQPRRHSRRTQDDTGTSRGTPRLRRIVIGVVPLLLALTPAGPAAAAPAPEPVPAPRPATPPAVTGLRLRAVKLAHASDMVHARKHLFVSTRDGVTVLKESGRTRKRLKHLPGAQGMVVSPKGDRVYVAVRDVARIVAIDTRTLKVVKRFKVGPCPSQLALAAGRLFYTREQCDTPDAAVESIDPRRGGRPVASGIPAATISSSMFLVGGGSTLVTASPTSSSQIRSYRVRGAAASVQAWHQEDSLVLDLAVSPDGATAYVPNNPAGVRAFPTSSLTDPVTYPTGSLPLAVAASRDGRQVAAAIHESGPDVFAFRVGSPVPTLVGSTATTPLGRPGVYTGTLTLSEDGKRLFVLRADLAEGPVYLESARTQVA